jgi:hypothetical protein
MLPHTGKANLEHLDLISRCRGCNFHIKTKVNFKEKTINKKFCSEECEKNYPKNKCRNCKEFKKGLICSRCKIGFYCSEECQKLYWKIHKEECKKEPKDKNKKFEYKIKVDENQWKSVDSLKDCTYFKNENCELLIRYGKLEGNNIICEENVIYIYYKLEGKFKELSDKLFESKRFPCVQGILSGSINKTILTLLLVLEKKNLFISTDVIRRVIMPYLPETKASICSCNGISDMISIVTKEHKTTKKKYWFTYPNVGYLLNLAHKTCTLGIYISKITNTKINEKYKLTLQLCKDHCKVLEDDNVTIAEFGIIAHKECKMFEYKK